MARLIDRVSDKPIIGILLAMLSIIIASVALSFGLYVHSATNSKFAAENAAKREVAAKIIPPFCKLIGGYAKLGVATTGTPDAIARSRENAANWAAVGVILHCP